MSETWDRFEAYTRELSDIASVIRLAHWDQEVMMPPAAGPGRARALATMQAISHERLTSPRLASMLDELSAAEDLDEAQAASVRVMRREYERATKIPENLVRELAELEATAFQVWAKARPANDFAMLEPHLARMLELKKQQADAVGWENERYDALIDEYEPGMTAREVETMFSDLGEHLRPLVDQIIGAAGERPEFLAREFDVEKQQRFSDWLVEELRFDTNAGRLDTSPHPFTMPVGSGDVRQTTKTTANELAMSIYATMHETGHALYEQNLPKELIGLPAGQVPSLGLHESQSRMWENQVGRSRGFTTHIFPRLKEMFPTELADVDVDAFYRGANHPKRTLIRVTADEVTYNLHVGLRFELELAMFRDELDVHDLPGAWDEAMERWVGITPPDAADGVLQDMHWSIGALGYFPTYTLGTMYAAAFFEKAEQDLGSLNERFAAGEVDPLLDWLRAHIYDKAYLKPAPELAEDVLGEPLSAQPFIRYLRTKFEDLYGRSFSA